MEERRKGKNEEKKRKAMCGRGRKGVKERKEMCEGKEEGKE